MKLVYHMVEKDRLWVAEHSSSNIGPIRVTASTREQARQKLEGEIRYWLEQCPCSGESYRNLELELEESG